MEEKIKQLCEQIKDLLKKNNKECLIIKTPEETYSTPGFTFPEYYKDIIDNEDYGSYFEDVCTDDILLDEYSEPIFVEDYDVEDYDEDDYEEDDVILYYEYTRFVLIAIRIESDKLVFCVEEIFTEDEQTVCVNVEEVSISSLVHDYDYESAVCALEEYVRILSDKT